jgi:hypothetical protein
VEGLIEGASNLPGSAISGSFPRLTTPARTVPPRSSAIEKGWSGLRTGLMVIGVLATIGVVLKLPIFSGFGKAVEATRPQPAFPPNTEATLYTDATEEAAANGVVTVRAGFGEGKQMLNAHAGEWKVENGLLVATQAGNLVENGLKLVPRTYVAKRYFSSDDFSAEVQMSYRDPGFDAVLEDGHQHYAELSYRVKDVQVSAFAIPEVGMRLLWRFYGPDGVEVVGNSARDMDGLVEDETPVPPAGKPFRVKLTLRKQKDGTLAEAFVNGERYARKLLKGLSGQAAKVALGCRNLRCEFDNLAVTGLSRPNAARRVADGGKQ